MPFSPSSHSSYSPPLPSFSPLLLVLRQFISLSSRCRARLRWVSRRRTPTPQFLRVRRFGLVTAVISFLASFVDFDLHFDLDDDDGVKLSVDNGELCFIFPSSTPF